MNYTDNHLTERIRRETDLNNWHFFNLHRQEEEAFRVFFYISFRLQNFRSNVIQSHDTSSVFVAWNVFCYLPEWFLVKWRKTYSFGSWPKSSQWKTSYRTKSAHCMFSNILFPLPSRFLLGGTCEQLALLNQVWFQP